MKWFVVVAGSIRYLGNAAACAWNVIHPQTTEEGGGGLSDKCYYADHSCYCTRSRIVS